MSVKKSKVTIGVDPGQTTGLAILEEQFLRSATTMITADHAGVILLYTCIMSAIALYYKGAFSIELVLEKPPSRGEPTQTALYLTLKGKLEQGLTRFPNVMLYESLPGQWKPPMKKVKMEMSPTHAKDAYLMALHHYRKVIK